MIALQNTTRRLQCYNLDAAHFETVEGPHGFQLIYAHVVDHDARTGALFPRRIPKSVCSSITFLASESKSELPDELLECLDVKLAVARGELRLLGRSKNPDPAPDPADEKTDDTKSSAPAPKSSKSKETP